VVSNDTIAAISTALGEGAVAVVRLSGPDAVAILGRLFRGACAVDGMEPRRQYFGVLEEEGRKLDEVLACVYRGPRSYTGEDVVEISCHGGVLLSRRVLEAVLARGARPAQPGEFTQRAFLAGRMDLTQAEAVMDLIAAQSDLALRAATEQLEGRLGERLRALKDGALEVLAHVEAYIDFPDEDIDPDTGAQLLGRLDALEHGCRELLATAGRGRLLREGVRTVIFGEPNVGKSSLLNLLLGYERAIVSARPGTTRDVIEEAVHVRGYALRLVDTAGLRESEDEIECEGMERTRRQLERADLALEVFDASQPRPAVLSGEPQQGQATRVCVLNKVDLGEHPSWAGAEAVRLSCLRGEGVGELEAAIVGRIDGGRTVKSDWALAINARHQAGLEKATGFVDAARGALKSGLSAEFVAEELRGVLEALGDLVGRTDAEDVLGKIFSSFCIGK